MTTAAARGVTIDDLEHSYGQEPVLRGLSLNVEPGESVALLGPSGCGKTTLLRLVAGLEKPTAGSIHLGGELVTGGAWVPPDRRRVGMVFQDWALFPHLSVANNVAYGIAKSATRDTEVAAALEMMNLADLGDRMPATLSGGQQQRVAIARSLVNDPFFILADEPTGNLDAESSTLVMDQLVEFQGLGGTVICATHDSALLARGTRVLQLSGGRVIN